MNMLLLRCFLLVWSICHGVILTFYVIYTTFFVKQVKTTSPKRFCVRPNSGIISPKSACDFTGICQLYIEHLNIYTI
ncbi:putative major sperm protein (MSP) [Helianthus anomalus]